MKVLFVSWPATGHLLPMLPLLRSAQRAGHDVAVSSGADMSAALSRLGVRGHASGLTFEQSYARLPGSATISAMPPSEQAAFAARHLFGAGGADRARDLLPFLRRERPDLVVHDLLEFGSPAAAAAAGIPHVTHGYGPLMPGFRRFTTEIADAVAEAGFDNPLPAVLASPYVDVCPPGLRGPEPSPWSQIHVLRPSAGDVAPGDELAAEFLDLPHPETIYVTLGTVMNRAPHVFRSVIQAATRLPVNLIVTTGPALDRTLLGPLPPATRVASYLPQAAVLPHCAAVVSHAGAGTMLGALCHGLPQLCLPQSTDQPFNAAALAATGAGLVLQPEQINADAVEQSLRRLLAEPSFRQAAQRLRDEIEAMPGPDEALDRILQLSFSPS